MTSGLITSWQIDRETVADFIFGCSQITADGDCSHEMKRLLLLGRKVMTNLVKMKVAQSCPTLWDPMDHTVLGILQARILEWLAFPFSRGIFPTQGQHIKKQRHYLVNKGMSSRGYVFFQ